MTKIVHADITGRVQGVYYRAWTQSEAKKRNLKGWVRNKRDGSVEAVFAGDESQVDDMLNVCREGPPAARVTDISVEKVEEADVPDGFELRPTV